MIECFPCSEIRGAEYPLMNLHERSLSVLGCRYVDELSWVHHGRSPRTWLVLTLHL